MTADIRQEKAFVILQHTLQMAKSIKGAGLKFLLDFHYSDTWADPGNNLNLLHGRA